MEKDFSLLPTKRDSEKCPLLPLSERHCCAAKCTVSKLVQTVQVFMDSTFGLGHRKQVEASASSKDESRGSSWMSMSTNWLCMVFCTLASSFHNLKSGCD